MDTLLTKLTLLTEKQLRARVALYTALLRNSRWEGSISFSALYDRRQGYREALRIRTESLIYRLTGNQ